MTDELETKTEAELSAVFAIEICGFHKEADTYWVDGNEDLVCDIPDFATDANAVLPWLEEYENVEFYFCSEDFDKWYVGILYNNGISGAFGFDKTFARAACIALIRAARARKGAGHE